MKKFLATLLVACFTFAASISTVGCSGDTKKDKDKKDEKKADEKKTDEKKTDTPK